MGLHGLLPGQGAPSPTYDAIAAPVATRSTSANLMGIFAGARRDDSWVVLSQSLSRQKGAGADQLRRSTLGRATDRVMAGADTNAPSLLPRNVDAVIDPDPHASSEERGRTDSSRTLRTRGLHSALSSLASPPRRSAAVHPAAFGDHGVRPRGVPRDHGTCYKPRDSAT